MLSFFYITMLNTYDVFNSLNLDQPIVHEEISTKLHTLKKFSLFRLRFLHRLLQISLHIQQPIWFKPIHIQLQRPCWILGSKASCRACMYAGQPLHLRLSILQVHWSQESWPYTLSWCFFASLVRLPRFLGCKVNHEVNLCGHPITSYARIESQNSFNSTFRSHYTRNQVFMRFLIPSKAFKRNN